MELRDHALAYAARGWPVFPLAERGKNPRTSNGFKDAATNPNVIERWWDRWPEANIGVPTGRAIGAWVLDVDPGKRGADSLAELESELGPLPDTLEQRTGSGGRHLFFAWVEGREVRNRQAVRPGIDVRGEGGYIVVPPSIHPDTGRTYDWSMGDDDPIVFAPAAWLDLLAPVKKAIAPWERVSPPRPRPRVSLKTPLIDRAKRYLAECEPAIQGSGGHNALLWAARALVVGFELDDQTAIGLLWSDFNPRCQPPWDEGDERERRDLERKVAEARRTPCEKPPGWLLDEYGLRSSAEELAKIAKGQESAANLLASVAQKAIANPTPIKLEDDARAEPPEVGERQPFPVDKFPDPIANFVHLVAESHQVDLAFAALPALAVAAAAMGNAWRLDLKRGFRVPPTLWVGLVSPSGTNKSGPLKDVVSPLRVPLPPQQLADSMLNPQGRMVVSDATLEAVVSRMRDNPRGLLVFRDELAGWIKSFNAYRKGGGGDEQAWLEFWGGGEYLVDRKTHDEQVHIPAASACVLGGIQPKVLVECFDPSRFSSGLVPRMLIACPPETDMFWSEAEVAPEAENAWHSVVTWLRTRPFAALDSNRGQYIPHILTLSVEAKAAYTSFFNALSLELKQTTDEAAKGLISKGRVIAARLALIHHGLLNACVGGDKVFEQVGLESVQAAAAWTRWCLEEQIRVYGFSAMAAREEHANYLLATIREKLPTPTATPRQLMRLNGRRYESRNAALAAMGQLVDQGYARWNDKKDKITLLPGAGETVE